MSTSSISGNLFLDQNGDGLFDGTDVEWVGSTVNLLNSAGSVVATTTTDANGNYSFTGIANGTYTVAFTAPSGDVFSLPPSVTNGDPASDVNAAGKTAALVLNGSNLTGVDAGFYAPVSVSGTVFNDNSDNGQFGGTDTLVSGDKVELLNAAGAVVATTTTASNGTYSFTGQLPGTYSVQIAQVSTPGAVFSPFGSNAAPEPTGGTPIITNNLITNGNFNDQGATGPTAVKNGLSGWTVSSNTSATPYGSGPGDGVEIAVTNGSTSMAYTTGSFTDGYASNAAEDNADPYFAQGSAPDAAYFVDDGAIETLSQTVNMVAGQTYEVGFDAFQTVPGTSNPGYFQLNAAINGTVITSMSSTSGVGTGTALPGGVWEHFADLYTATSTGPATLTFTYSSGTPGSTLASKDVLVDDVYIVPGQVTPSLSTTSEVYPSGQTAQFTLSSGQQIGDESAGIYLSPATINGTVFADTNGDGVLDGSEAGVSGRTVNLSLNGTVVATTVTASNGTYSFGNLGPGAYSVAISAPSGDVFSPAGTSTTGTDSTVNSSGVQSVTLVNGSTATVNAGVYANSTVTGTVFTDSNADGVKQSGESGVKSVTVELLNASGSVIGTTTTNSSGTYTFSGVAPGSDTVYVQAPTGDVISPVGTSTTLPDSVVASTGKDAITVTSGSTTTVNAGVYADASISGTVYNDLNGDGTQETAEPGLAGQTVTLLNASGATVATTTTGTGGTYSFASLTPGSYTVQVTAASGDSFTTASSKAITLTSGGTGTFNAGEDAPSTVSGTVFADTNADGVQQAGEAGVSGVTVDLLNASGTQIATTTTATNGSYSFTGVAPGSDTVKIVAPSGDVMSPVGTSTTLPDSDVASTGKAGVTITSGSASTVNAGVYANASVSGTVFDDLNGDGTQESGEPGLAGQTVSLMSGSTVVATTTTGANGSYNFTNVTPGSYTVAITGASGDVFTTPSSAAITLPSGGAAVVNAGEYAPSTVGGTVFADTNANGVQETGEAGVSGVTVDLVNAAGTVIATTTTGSNGSYSFNNVGPGSDTVQIVTPSGDVISPLGTSTTRPDSDVAANGKAAVTITSGSSTTVNAGVYANATVTGTVFNDLNGDGTQETAEPGLAGQTVKLLNGATVIASTTTGANGSYSFNNITPGSYTVAVTGANGDAFTTPSSTAITLASGGAASFNAGEYAPSTVNGTVFSDSNADGVQESGEAGAPGITVQLLNGTTVLGTTTTNANGSYTFTGVAPGADKIVVSAPSGDFISTNGGSGVLPLTVRSGSTDNAGSTGIYGDASVSGTIFTDLTASGVQTVNDPGLAGQTVQLLSGTSVIATATTAADGSYSFGNITPGQYTVNVVGAARDHFSTSSSDALTLTSGEAASFNAGEYADVSLSGKVFLDSNADGVEDKGETGLGGVTVQLVNANGVAIAGDSTTTAADGSYSFGDLLPGSYGVKITPPAGLTISPIGTAAAPAIDNIANAAGVIAPVTLTSGAAATGLNAGVAATGALSSFVFFDGQSDGIYHVGDAGVAGVTVNLLNSLGVVVGTTTTNSEGQYGFSDLSAGSYQVQVVAPQGTAFSTQEHASGNPQLDSDVNSQGLSDAIVVTANNTTLGANAGLVLTGDFANTSPTTLAPGQSYAGSTGGTVVTGAGGNNVHTGAPGNNVVVLGGNGNTIELGQNSTAQQDIGVSTGTLQAQTQQADNGYLFAGGTGSELCGGTGYSYLMGGTGSSVLLAGSGNATLIAGGSNSLIDLGTGSDAVVYQAGDGFLQIDGTWSANDTLNIYGYSGGQITTVNSIKELVLSATDVIEFVGNTPYANGPTTGAAGLTFDANVLDAPIEELSFTASGLPVFSAGSASTPLAAPTAPVTPVAPSVETESSSGQVLSLASGTDTLHLFGYNNTVTQASGVNDGVSIDGDAGYSIFTLGNGNNSLVFTGANETVTAGSGDNTITSTAGSLTIVTTGAGDITADGYNNHITLGDGASTVSGIQGYSTVSVGNSGGAGGTITMAGQNNTATTAGGNWAVTAGNGNDTVSVNAADDTVTLWGYDNAVSVSTGHAAISGSQGYDTFSVTNFAAAGYSSASLDINDFNLAQGDVLDLSGVLETAGYTSANAASGITIQAANGGADTEVFVNNGGTNYLVADLHGVAASSLSIGHGLTV